MKALGYYRVGDPARRDAKTTWPVIDPEGNDLGFDITTFDAAIRVASSLNRQRIDIAKTSKQGAA